MKAADTEYPPFLSATPFQERRGVSGSGLALREHPGTVGLPDAVKRAFHTAVVKLVYTGVSKTLVAPHGSQARGSAGSNPVGGIISETKENVWHGAFMS